jgi:hypothetical protein
LREALSLSQIARRSQVHLTVPGSPSQFRAVSCRRRRAGGFRSCRCRSTAGTGCAKGQPGRHHIPAQRKGGGDPAHHGGSARPTTWRALPPTCGPGHPQQQGVQVRHTSVMQRTGRQQPLHPRTGRLVPLGGRDDTDRSGVEQVLGGHTWTLQVMHGRSRSSAPALSPAGRHGGVSWRPWPPARRSVGSARAGEQVAGDPADRRRHRSGRRHAGRWRGGATGRHGVSPMNVHQLVERPDGVVGTWPPGVERRCDIPAAPDRSETGDGAADQVERIPGNQAHVVRFGAGRPKQMPVDLRMRLVHAGALRADQR